jgi:hypothetical protein
MMNKFIKIDSCGQFSEEYSQAKPFSHIVLNNIWNQDVLDLARQEVENFSLWAGEKSFYGSRKKRFQSNFSDLPPQVKELFYYLNGSEFLKILEEITGEIGLISDPYLLGGGIHSTGSGGFLKLHADFNWHQKMKIYRRLNVLIYLNKNWMSEYGGELELAEMQNNGELQIIKSVHPTFNTTVIFTTDDHSFHGQSVPLNTPEHIRRNSLAAYYYVAQKPQGTADVARMSTDYRDLSGRQLIGGFPVKNKKI